MGEDGCGFTRVRIVYDSVSNPGTPLVRLDRSSPKGTFELVVVAEFWSAECMINVFMVWWCINRNDGDPRFTSDLLIWPQSIGKVRDSVVGQ